MGDYSPALTVVIPAYNAVRTLPDTLRSLQAQTMTDWEAIVVDDGSTDNTYGLARAFGERDPRIWAIRFAGNQGASTAANFGMCRASGRYFAVLAADDYWLEDFMKHVVWVLDVYPDAEGVYTDFIEWYEADGIKKVHRTPRTSGFNRELLKRRCFVNLSAFVARRPISLDSEWNPVADWDYLLRLDGRLLHVPEILAVRRFHAQQISAGLGTPKMFWKRLLLPYRYDTFLDATRTALWRLKGAIWSIATRPRVTLK